MPSVVQTSQHHPRWALSHQFERVQNACPRLFRRGGDAQAEFKDACMIVFVPFQQFHLRAELKVPEAVHSECASSSVGGPLECEARREGVGSRRVERLAGELGRSPLEPAECCTIGRL